MKTIIDDENAAKPQKENPIHVVKNEPSEKYVLPDKEEVKKISRELIEEYRDVYEALAK